MDNLFLCFSSLRDPSEFCHLTIRKLFCYFDISIHCILCFCLNNLLSVDCLKIIPKLSWYPQNHCSLRCKLYLAINEFTDMLLRHIHPGCKLLLTHTSIIQLLFNRCPRWRCNKTAASHHSTTSQTCHLGH